MPQAAKAYVRWVDAFNRRVGRFAMYGIFALVGVLLWSSVSKTFFQPSLWTLEVAQFLMVAYYILGGSYAIQLGSNVRMDLFYGGWSPKTRAWVDVFTVFFLLFYLAVLLRGGVGSAAYSLGHWGDEPFAFFGRIAGAFVTGGPDAAAEIIGRAERSSTAWRPYIWPIKLLMCFGIILMILQSLSELFKDVARIRGEDL